MFHKHDWDVVERTYVPPCSFPGVDMQGCGPDDLNRLLAQAVGGLTTILWECRICHRLRQEQMLGKKEQQQ